MHLSVDAWLERREPLIRLYDRDTGKTHGKIDAAGVRRLIKQGDLEPRDLCTTDDLPPDLIGLMLYVLDGK